MLKKINRLIILVSALLSSSFVLAQTCDEEILLTAPTGRFTVGEGIINDKKTGLIWSRCAVGQVFNSQGTEPCSGNASQLNWKEALDESTRFEGGSRLDWRLPSIKELSSLVERACFSPAINEGLFPLTEGHYWTSSPDIQGNGPLAWIVDFNFGGDGKIGKHLLRSVRFVAGGDTF
ncbi:MAG: DUF1566 domain-containing protein [Kangiellaceae bacterium]|nr:DUF1566 domain-containing protein [Kangiellaceae bacterium]